MNDDLGRGQVGWSSDQWQELDKLAGDTVSSQVVLRNLVDHQDTQDVRSVRMAGKNIDVKPIQSEEFNFDMADEDWEDLRRKVTDKAQDLAKKEDIEILKAMVSGTVLNAPIGFDAFSKARATLGKEGVQQGFGVVVSPQALSELEVEVKGLRSGLDLVEQSLSTKVAQSSALPLNKDEAIVVQSSPAAYRIVHVAGPQIRVLQLAEGKKVKFRVEEWVAVGELQPKRCVLIEPKP